MAQDNSTGHVWDEDLREKNNPLPRWWMGLFVATLVFSAAYLSFYPGLGSRRARSAGPAWGSTRRSRRMPQPRRRRCTRSSPASRAQLVHDPQAMAIGERLFANNCATCHGADARGSRASRT